MSKSMLIGLGVALLFAAVLLLRRAARYDLKGVVTDAAWQAVKARGLPEQQTELEQRARAFGAASNPDRARMAASAVGGHAFGKVLQIIAWLMAASGLGLALFGILWSR